MESVHVFTNICKHGGVICYEFVISRILVFDKKNVELDASFPDCLLTSSGFLVHLQIVRYKSEVFLNLI